MDSVRQDTTIVIYWYLIPLREPGISLHYTKVPLRFLRGELEKPSALTFALWYKTSVLSGSAQLDIPVLWIRRSVVL